MRLRRNGRVIRRKAPLIERSLNDPESGVLVLNG
jgi:hypothetical protein